MNYQLVSWYRFRLQSTRKDPVIGNAWVRLEGSSGIVLGKLLLSSI